MTTTEQLQTARKTSAITPNFSSPERVTVLPEDGSRFLQTIQRAITVGQAANHSVGVAAAPVETALATERFEQTLLRPLRSWCEANAARVTACYVAVADRRLEAYIVGRSVRYDFDLGDEVARLELGFVSGGWRVYTMLIPAPESADELQAYFDRDSAIEIYKEPGSPSGCMSHHEEDVNVSSDQQGARNEYKQYPHDQDVESLAIWLQAGAKRWSKQDGHRALREIAKMAIVEIVELYEDEPGTSLGAREILTRFVDMLDTIERDDSFIQADQIPG